MNGSYDLESEPDHKIWAIFPLADVPEPASIGAQRPRAVCKFLKGIAKLSSKNRLSEVDALVTCCLSVETAEYSLLPISVSSSVKSTEIQHLATLT